MALDNNPGENRSEMFAMSRQNYRILLIGMAVLIIGFLLMIGGGSENPKEFDPSIFSFRRITLAPIVTLLGYAVIFYAILHKPKS